MPKENLSLGDALSGHLSVEQRGTIEGSQVFSRFAFCEQHKVEGTARLVLFIVYHVLVLSEVPSQFQEGDLKVFMLGLIHLV